MNTRRFPACSGYGLLPMAHGGGDHLARGVEVQQQSCVDRALFGGFTTFGIYTKHDNFVHIAHNCQIGRRNLIAVCAMLAGTVTTGDDVSGRRPPSRARSRWARARM